MKMANGNKPETTGRTRSYQMKKIGIVLLILCLFLVGLFAVACGDSSTENTSKEQETEKGGGTTPSERIVVKPIQNGGSYEFNKK